MFKRAVKGEVKFPSHVSEECADLVSKLLNLDSTQRLGMQRHGAQDIKDHAWYKGFDWISFEAQTMPAPYVPVVRGSCHATKQAVGHQTLQGCLLSSVQKVHTSARLRSVRMFTH
jgi:hypothetical protein